MWDLKGSKVVVYRGFARHIPVLCRRTKLSMLLGFGLVVGGGPGLVEGAGEVWFRRWPCLPLGGCGFGDGGDRGGNRDCGWLAAWLRA